MFDAGSKITSPVISVPVSVKSIVLPSVTVVLSSAVVDAIVIVPPAWVTSIFAPPAIVTEPPPEPFAAVKSNEGSVAPVVLNVWASFVILPSTSEVRNPEVVLSYKLKSSSTTKSNSLEPSS